MASNSSSVTITEDQVSSFEKNMEDHESSEDCLRFEIIECSDENVDDLDIVLIPVKTNEHGENTIVKGSNPVFDKFLQTNERAAVQFFFLNETGKPDGWVVSPHVDENLFITKGLVTHKKEIFAYLDANCNISSDGTKQCFFNIHEYNSHPNLRTFLVAGSDYVPFCPFRDVSPDPTIIDGNKYFRFPGSFYKGYRDLVLSPSDPSPILLLGIQKRTYGSLFKDDSLPYENKAHYLELTDPITPLFLSLMRKYDYIMFKHSKTTPGQWIIDVSRTHPKLVSWYSQNQEFINRFMSELEHREMTIEDELNNPFVSTIKDKNGVYHLNISALFMEHIVAKVLKTTELSENFKKVVQMIIQCGKQERFISQKIDLSEETLDPNRTFYLIVEDSIFQKNIPLVKKYFDC